MSNRIDINGNKAVYPRLVGGTLCSVFLFYKKQYFKSDKKMTDSIFFSGLLNAVDKEVSYDSVKKRIDTFRVQVKDLKTCKSNAFGQTYLERQKLNALKGSGFADACKRLRDFIGEYLREGAEKNIVAALKELVEEDPAIDGEEEFRVDTSNSKLTLTKNEIAESLNIPFIPFIMSCLIYAFLQEKNKEGAFTLEKWKDGTTLASLGSKYVDGLNDNLVLNNSAKETVEKVDEKKSDSQNTSRANVPAPFPWRKIDDEEFLYCIDERDYQALWKQANNHKRDQRDLNILVAEIKRKKNLYVKTNIYRETFNRILELGYVLLVGNPGTGKSMTSELVALKFAGLGNYIVHYLKDYDEADVKNLYDEISCPKAEGEMHFILIDDCMGQAFYQLGSDEEKWFYNLVAYIMMRPHRLKLLLNSRINIVESSKQHRIYERVFDEMFKTRRIVDANRLSRIEKALILRAHIVARSDRAHYEDINGKRAVEIVDHKHYIPRIIFHVTDKCRPIKKSGDFYNEIIAALDNPSSIWDEIYDNDKATPPEARILLKALFSLTNTMVEVNCCMMVFDEYLKLSGVNTEPRKAWKVALNSLNTSMIKREIGAEETIGFADASVHDFLFGSVFTWGSRDWKSLFEGIVHRLQIKKLYGSGEDRILETLAEDGRILSLEYNTDIEKHLEIFEVILSKGYCLEEYKNVFTKALDYLSKTYNPGNVGYNLFRLSKYENLGNRMLIELMGNFELRKFYCGELINRHIYSACTKRIDLYYATVIIEKYYDVKTPCFSFDFNIETMRDLVTVACDYTSVDTDDYIKELVDELNTDDSRILNPAINEKVHDTFISAIEHIRWSLPEDVYEALYDAVDNYECCGDYSADIKDYVTYDDRMEYEYDVYKENLAFAHTVDSGIEAIFDTPFDQNPNPS